MTGLNLFQSRGPLTPLPTGQVPSGALPGPVRCILFDVYGTLFISGSGDIESAVRRERLVEGTTRLLEGHGLDLDAAQVVEAFFSAIRAEHRRKKEAGTDFPEVDIEKIWMQVLGPRLPRGFSVKAFALDYEQMANPVWPMPHMAETLKALCKRRMILGIVSNAQFYTPLLFQRFLGKPLERLGFDPHLALFSYVFAVAKPSAALFEQAKKRLARRNVSPSETLYVGNDMRNDMLPAAHTGFATALFAGDARSLRLRSEDTACAGLKPDLVITDLIQLLDQV